MGYKRRPASSNRKTSPPGPGIYLAKDTDELVSHCKCATAMVTIPGQMSCPWCGCGWLFSCIACRKAFTFAVGVRTEMSWEELAREDLRRGGWTASDNLVSAWIADMKVLLAGIDVGRRYVFFDGAFFPADAGPIEHVGWFASHELPRMPQTAALTAPAIVDQLLSNREYWLRNERPDRE